MMNKPVNDPITTELPQTIVLGNAPLTEAEKQLLWASSNLRESRIFTAGMAFENKITLLPWGRKIAVVQDYLLQELREESSPINYLTALRQFDKVIVVETLFDGVNYHDLDPPGLELLTHLRRVRLLNRVAGTKFFRLDSEYLPSTGILALALAIESVHASHAGETIGMAGISLEGDLSYSLEVPSPERLRIASGGELNCFGREIFRTRRNHFRPDALAIAAFSYNSRIISTRSQISLLTTTWPNGSGELLANKRRDRTWTEGADSLVKYGLQRWRRAGLRSLGDLLWRQARYPFRIRKF